MIIVRYIFAMSLLLQGIGAKGQQAIADSAQDEPFNLFLIGDAGAAGTNGADNVLQLLKENLLKAGEKSAIIYLGDNIYPNGLPPKGNRRRPNAEKQLRAQLDILKDYKGHAFMIPGNHDWNLALNGGWDYVKEEAEFVESYLDNANIYFPKNGCPGPVEVSLTKAITLVIIDTQWWLHRWEKPSNTKECKYYDNETFLKAFDEVLERNKEKKIIVAAHHPLYSKGPHGGFFPLKTHIFPLTDLNRNLFIPLPIVGSIYPLYRSVLGTIQDIPHRKYRLLRKKLVETMIKCKDVTYVSGHDHSLQFFKKDSINYIISGAGSKITYVRKTSAPDFALAAKGFAKITFSKDENDSLKFYYMMPHKDDSTIIFSKDLIIGNEKLGRAKKVDVKSQPITPSQPFFEKAIVEFLQKYNFRVGNDKKNSELRKPSKES